MFAARISSSSGLTLFPPINKFSEANSNAVNQMEHNLIAPCGMNCGVCAGYLALRNDIKRKGIRIPYCAGCRPRGKKCAFLKKRCTLLLNGIVQYCFECAGYPCNNLVHLDKRYRTLYRMSMIENLSYIKEKGIELFLEKEKVKWHCPQCSEIVSCHNGICFNCGIDLLMNKKKIYRWEDA
jgi:hypothetical protein